MHALTTLRNFNETNYSRRPFVFKLTIFLRPFYFATMYPKTKAFWSIRIRCAQRPELGSQSRSHSQHLYIIQNSKRNKTFYRRPDVCLCVGAFEYRGETVRDVDRTATSHWRQHYCQLNMQLWALSQRKDLFQTMPIVWPPFSLLIPFKNTTLSSFVDYFIFIHFLRALHVYTRRPSVERQTIYK